MNNWPAPWREDTVPSARTQARRSGTYHHIQQSSIRPDIWLPQSQNVSVSVKHYREREDRTSSEPADLHFTVNNRRKGREEEEGCVKKSLTEARNRALQTNVDSSKYYKCLNHSKSKNVTDNWVILKPSLCVSAPMTRNCCLEGRAVGALVKQ